MLEIQIFSIILSKGYFRLSVLTIFTSNDEYSLLKIEKGAAVNDWDALYLKKFFF